MIIYKTDQPISQKKLLVQMKPEMNQSALAQKIVGAKFSQTNIFFCDLEDIKPFKFVSREGEEWIMEFLEMKGLTSLHLDRSNHYYPFRMVSYLHQLP